MFLVGTTNVGIQNPHELIKYCPPHLCFVCFITLPDSYKANLILKNFNKKLGFGQTPPPLVGPNSQLLPKTKCEGSPYRYCSSVDLFRRLPVDEHSVWAHFEAFWPGFLTNIEHPLEQLASILNGSAPENLESTLSARIIHKFCPNQPQCIYWGDFLRSVPQKKLKSKLINRNTLTRVGGLNRFSAPIDETNHGTSYSGLTKYFCHVQILSVTL